MRLLLAGEDVELQAATAVWLRENGYGVDCCESGRAAVDHLLCLEYDAVVLSADLGDMEEGELVRRLREADDLTPLLLVGRSRSVGERVRLFNLGADDFLSRPYALEELAARLRVHLRRRAGRGTNIFRAADLTVDCNTRLAKRGEREIRLTAREFALLEYLIAHQGLVLSRQKIENHVWSAAYEGGSNVVDVYISYLRRKLDQDFPVKLIHTVRSAGYVLRVG